MSDSSEASIEEEEETTATKFTRTEPKFLNSRTRTESFDEMVSDELVIALAMMRVNSLSSLNEKQKERVKKLREKIKAGESAKDGTSHSHKHRKSKSNSMGKDFEVAGWSTVPNPSEKAVLPLDITHKILSGRTPQNVGQESSNCATTETKRAAEPSAKTSTKKRCESGEPSGTGCEATHGGKESEECAGGGVARTVEPSVEQSTDKNQITKGTVSNVDISTQSSREESASPMDVAYKTVGQAQAHNVAVKTVSGTNVAKTGEASSESSDDPIGGETCYDHSGISTEECGLNGPEQGEYNRLGDSNQLGECLEKHTSSEENEKHDELSVTSDVQKIPLLESSAVTESNPSLAGYSSLHTTSTKDNTAGSESSIDRKSETTSSAFKSDGETNSKIKTEQSNGGGSKSSKTRHTRKKRFNAPILCNSSFQVFHTCIYRSRWSKGAKKYKSLPPLENQPSTPQLNQPVVPKRYSHPVTVKHKFQPASSKLNFRLSMQRQPSPGRFILKPHFASVAESTPRTGSFPSQYWVVDNGVRSPQVASKNKERISWKAVLEDAGNIDGYRKIHADKLKWEAGEVSS